MNCDEKLTTKAPKLGKGSMDPFHEAQLTMPPILNRLNFEAYSIDLVVEHTVPRTNVYCLLPITTLTLAIVPGSFRPISSSMPGRPKKVSRQRSITLLALCERPRTSANIGRQSREATLYCVFLQSEHKRQTSAINRTYQIPK